MRRIAGNESFVNLDANLATQRQIVLGALKGLFTVGISPFVGRSEAVYFRTYKDNILGNGRGQTLFPWGAISE